MIELPEDPAPRSFTAGLMDFGFILKPSTGAAASRLDRKGSRFRLSVQFPPMKPEKAAVFVSRLLRAKSAGLRIALPLLVPQGSPGAPVVDGAGQTGTALNVRGLNPGYAVKEGFWLSIEDASGQHYLHNVAAPVRADGSGDAALTITPELRTPFADGATINLAVPMVEGFVSGDAWEWQTPVEKLIALEFPLEEAA